MDEFLDGLSGRMRKAAAMQNLSIADVARALGMKHAAVSHYFNGQNEPKARTLVRFSEIVGVPIQDLLSPPSELTEPEGAAQFSSGEFVKLPIRNVELSAGTGTFPADEEITGHLAFQAAWLRSQGISQNAATICKVFGDSMAPTIMEGDMALIDHRKINPIGKEVFAIRLEDQLYVKRLEVNHDDLSLFIHSDNPGYATWRIPKEERDANPIIGKVVWSARTWRDDVR